MTIPTVRRGFFVTGTDTGVGKTTISAALLRSARREGLRPIPFKPAETGCTPEPADARALWRAAEPPVSPDDVCLYTLRLPVAPAHAAAAEAVQIELDRIVERANWLAGRGDALLVEGAGGLLVPYATGVTGADIAKRLGLPLLVVARTALGTINHTALTLREAARARLPIAGLIFNRTSPDEGPQEIANADLIAELTGQRPMGTFPWMGDRATDPEALADALAASVPAAVLSQLWRRAD